MNFKKINLFVFLLMFFTINFYPDNTLSEAIKRKDFEAALKLLSDGANPNTQDPLNKNTPLHEIIQVLIESFNQTGQPYIRQTIEVIDKLLEKKALISTTNSFFQTPFSSINFLERSPEIANQIKKIVEECYIKAGHHKISLTKYKTEKNEIFKCKRVSIFINNHFQAQDPVLKDFNQAIIQKSSPIIISRNLLKQGLDTLNILNELETNWIICSRTRYGTDSYYLLFPKIIETPFDTTKTATYLSNLGFDENLLQHDFSSLYLSNDKDPDNNRNLFFKNELSLFKPTSGPWNIYLDGHGLKGSHIAGLSHNLFEQFLNFLSKNIITNFLFYSTCYGGGINLVKPYLTKVNESGAISSTNINFTIAEDAATESVSQASSWYTDPFCIAKPNFKNFFEGLENIFNCTTNSSEKWNDILYSVITQEGEHVRSTNEPLIKFPGTDFFQAHLISDKIELLTTTKLKAKILDGIETININNNKDILLLYPPIIPLPLRLPINDHFKILPMNPEGSLFFFKEIISQKEFTNYKDSLISLFELHDSFLGHNIFVIKNWKFNNGYEFSNVVFDYNEKNIKIHLQIIHSPDLQEIENYIEINFQVDNPQDGFSCSPMNRRIGRISVPLKERSIIEDYSNKKILLRDAQGNLLAPWQEEREPLALFAIQELGLKSYMNQHEQEIANLVKTRFFYDNEHVNKMRDILIKMRQRQQQPIGFLNKAIPGLKASSTRRKAS